MNLCELYVIEGEAENKEEAIKLTSEVLSANGAVKEGFWESCVEREKNYPTGLTEYCPVAIPHTTKDFVNKDAICVLKLKNPVKFASMEDWEKEIDVRDFIQKNYTPYEGDDSFLAEATESTKKLWNEVLDLYKKETENGGVLAISNDIASTITSHEAGYIDKDYEKIVPIIKKHNLVVLSDEIYAELSYNDDFCSIASFDEIKDQVIVLNGFSKAYSMTGWRLGYILANEDIISAMVKIHQYTIMCPSTISQYAGIEAIKNGDKDCVMHKESFMARRNYLVNNLNRIGLDCHMPNGAFYVFPSIKKTGMSSEEFCTRLVHEAKVAVVPGNAFGDSGEGHVRISYAYSIEQIKEAIERIESFLKKIEESA